MIRNMILTIASMSMAASAATILGPVYPPPGGVTFVGSGSTGSGIGRTQFYTGMDLSATEDLWWGYASIDNPRHSSQASTGQMVFSSYNPVTGLATWNSTANMTWSTAFGTQSIATRMVVQFQPYTGVASGFLGSGFLTPTTKGAAGITGNPLESVLLVTGDFQAQIRYETAGGTPLLDYYNGTSSLGGIAVTNSNAGFWYSETPEPVSLALTGLGLLAVGVLGRRCRH
ncbi:MAG: PEP-CTERM sorting domain-containing protein [Bryobacteraceae bacterium]